MLVDQSYSCICIKFASSLAAGQKEVFSLELGLFCYFSKQYFYTFIVMQLGEIKFRSIFKSCGKVKA